MIDWQTAIARAMVQVLGAQLAHPGWAFSFAAHLLSLPAMNWTVLTILAISLSGICMSDLSVQM